MATYAQNLLAIHANKHILAFKPVVASLTRAARQFVLGAGAHATLAKNAMTQHLHIVRRFFTYGNLALAGGLWVTLALGDVAARVPRDAARAIEPMRLTIADHWARAIGVLTAAISSVERITTCCRLPPPASSIRPTMP